MIGKQIGPYKIVEKLGEGGMGVVYKGIHTQIEQVVAIKALYPNYAKDQEFRERFIREAKTQAKFHHPNLVNILNYLEDQDGNMYIVMEYVDGGSLEDRLKRGAFNIKDAVSVIVQVLNALAYMHSKGIVHRDIKPANIMFSGDTVKVSDFGIAKPIADKGLTRTGAIVGTVLYMAPEVIKGEPATYAGDLYAVGVILYQMLTGRSPFFGRTDFEIMKAHTEKDPPSLEELVPHIPKGIGDIVKKALAKDPKDRFKSAEEFKTALIDWFSGLSDSSKLKVLNLDTSATERKTYSIPINRTYILVGASLLLLILLILVFLLFTKREKPRDVPGLLKLDTPSAPTVITPQKQNTPQVEASQKEEEPAHKQEEPEKKQEDSQRKKVKKAQEKHEDLKQAEEPEKQKETNEDAKGGKQKWEVIK
ncbi:serine/threonine protein kinase [Hydrogenobacter thermophilus]|uniref:serine/threonine protein kinase n=1 Tax=Hydrogenobacter thermophilus TaxID=940 RepID=UPI0030FC244B